MAIISPLIDTSLPQIQGKKIDISFFSTASSNAMLKAIEAMQKPSEISPQQYLLNQKKFIETHNARSETSNENLTKAYLPSKDTTQKSFSPAAQILIDLLSKINDKQVPSYANNQSAFTKINYLYIDTLENSLSLTYFKQNKSELNHNQLIQLRLLSTLLSTGLFYENHVYKSFRQKWPLNLLEQENTFLALHSEQTLPSSNRLSQQIQLLFNHFLSVDIPLNLQQTAKLTLYFPFELFFDLNQQKVESNSEEHQKKLRQKFPWKVNLAITLPQLGHLKITLKLQNKLANLSILCEHNDAIKQIKSYETRLIDQFSQQNISTESITAKLKNV